MMQMLQKLSTISLLHTLSRWAHVNIYVYWAYALGVSVYASIHWVGVGGDAYVYMGSMCVYIYTLDIYIMHWVYDGIYV